MVVKVMVNVNVNVDDDDLPASSWMLPEYLCLA